MLRSASTRAYSQLRRPSLLASGGFEQLADRDDHTVPTVIESAGVHQRSGRFASVRINNRIPGSGSLLPRMPSHSAFGWAVTSRRPTRACVCLISSGVFGIQRQRATTRPRRPRAWRNELDRPAGSAAHPGASRSRGLSVVRQRATDRTAHRSFRVLAVPPALPHSPEPVHAVRRIRSPAERLSTSSASGPCPRPEQVQDRNPTQ
jgi:hypothetical protein